MISHRYYIILLFTSEAVSFYQWLEFNDYNLDCTVGITIDNKPVSIGVFITNQTIITSANPLNEYLDSPERILVYIINHSYKVSLPRRVKSVAGNQSFRKQSWVTVGYKKKSHTTIHDIALINLVPKDGIKEYLHNFYLPQPERIRIPFPVNIWELDNDKTYLHRSGWVIAGFGYVDQKHIEENYILEYNYFDATLVDCDEWIPREWGRFLCLLDETGLAGLASGAPLFWYMRRNWIKFCGIGSFSLKKDKYHILVFTDLIPYVNNLYGF